MWPSSLVEPLRRPFWAVEGWFGIFIADCFSVLLLQCCPVRKIEGLVWYMIHCNFSYWLLNREALDHSTNGKRTPRATPERSPSDQFLSCGAASEAGCYGFSPTLTEDMPL